MAEFDERLRGVMVNYVTVGADGGMTVVFRDGNEFYPMRRKTPSFSSGDISRVLRIYVSN